MALNELQKIKDIGQFSFLRLVVCGAIQIARGPSPYGTIRPQDAARSRGLLQGASLKDLGA